MDIKRSRNKLNPNLFTVVDTEKKERKRQAILHEKYQDIPKDTVIIENRAVKTFSKDLKKVAKGIGWIIGIAGWAVALICLALPETRNPFLQYITDLFEWLKDTMPFLNRQ
ncbi:MAG: hypothetical protein IKS18_00685 [Lachnospiraceae bacterium]|nr:hypothetical protein [Lachnospiraceae bacterium]